MRLVEHPCDPGRAESLTVHHTAEVHGLAVVMGQFTGREHKDYFVATYFPDGTKAAGACMSTRSRDRAMDEWLGTVRMWRDRPDEATAIVSRYEAA